MQAVKVRVLSWAPFRRSQTSRSVQLGTPARVPGALWPRAKTLPRSRRPQRQRKPNRARRRSRADKKRRDGKAAATLQKFEWFMRSALPAIGSRPINEISAREVLVVLKEVEALGIHETARKLRTAIGDVFRYAIATARAENDPTTASRGALVTPTVTPRADIVAPEAFGGLLRAIEDYQGALEPGPHSNCSP